MRRSTAIRGFIAALAMTCGLASAAQAPRLAIFDGIEAGRWQLREQDPAASRTLCVTDPAVLIQLRHGAALCARFVISSSPHEATVRYTCPGAGYGQTTVKVETPRLIHVDTQGVAEGAPFALLFEGRRIGPCGGAASR